jgi:hypothetical protein
MAKEYKSRGGGYKTDKKDQDESQKHLSKWTEEEWQTKEGSGHAKRENGTRKRYLPKKAWETMSEKEKQDTEEQKGQGSKSGKQYVLNTSRAKSARKKANDEEDQVFEKKKVQEKGAQSGRRRTGSRKVAKQSEQGPATEDAEKEARPDSKQNFPPKNVGQKRVRGRETKDDTEGKPPSKKQRDNRKSPKDKE